MIVDSAPLFLDDMMTRITKTVAGETDIVMTEGRPVLAAKAGWKPFMSTLPRPMRGVIAS